MNATLPRCLVIGAAGGIGRALVSRLAGRGWPLLLAGRTVQPLEALAAQIPGSEVITLDARDAPAMDRVFERNPDLAAAVNLAGSILLKPAHLTLSEEFADTMDLNLLTAFNLVRAAGRSMRARGGSVVLMSSCAATLGLGNHEAIAAAKAGVEGLVRAAAATYASSGIRFNAVAPGLVDSPLSGRIVRSDGALKASLALHPLGRIGSTDEIARCIEFLLDPDSGWITGQVMGVDGGLGRVRSR